MKAGTLGIPYGFIKNACLLLCILLVSLASFAQVTPKDYYWVGGSGSWQSPTTHWATTSGGSVFHSSVPSQFDRVIFDENSFSEAGQEVTMVAEGFCGEFRSTNIMRGVKFTAYKKLNVYSGFSIDSNLTFSLTEGGINIIAGGFTIGKNVSFTVVGKFELGSGNMLLQRLSSFTQSAGDLVVTSGTVTLEPRSTFNQYGNMSLGNGSFTVSDSVKWTKYNYLTLTKGDFIIGKNDTISLISYGGLNCAEGTVVLDSSSSIRLDYWTTIGKGDLRIRNGAKWECYHPLSISTGSLKVDSGGFYTQQYWVNVERSLDLHPSASVNNSARYYLHGDTAGLYVRTGNRDLRRIEIDGNNGVYTFLDDVKLYDDGLFLYGYNNTFRFNSINIDVYNFYSWTSNPQTIDLTSIDTVKVKREYRVYNTTVVQGDPVIYFRSTDNFYMTGSGETPVKTYTKVYMHAENEGETDMAFLGRTSVKTVYGLAKGAQRLYLESPKIKNLSLLYDRNMSYTHRIEQNNGSAEIDTFNVVSDYNINTDLTTRGSNYLGRLNIQKLVKWTIGSGQTQTLDTLLWPITGTCGSEVILQSTQQGTAGTLSMADGTLSADWLKIRDCIATGGATFEADNTVNFGNVTGWDINAIPPRTFYWVGGSGNWNDGSHWALSSGGAPLNCAIPNQADDVVFDDSSFTNAGEYVNVNVTADVRNMTWGNVVSGAQFSGSDEFNLWGSLELNRNMVFNFNGTLNFIASTKDNTIKTDSVKLNNVFFGRSSASDTASWILQDDFNNENATFYLQHGKLITNGKLIRSNVFYNWDAGTSYIDWTGTDTVFIKHQFLSWYNTVWTSRPGTVKFTGQDNFYLIGGNHEYGQIEMNAESPYSYIQFSNDVRAQDVTINAAGSQYIVLYDYLTARDLRIRYMDTTEGNPTVDLHHNNGTLRNFSIEAAGLRRPNVFWRYTNTYDSVVFKNISLLYLAPGHTKTINQGMLITGGACDNRIPLYAENPTTYISMPDTAAFLGDWLNIKNVSVLGGGTFTVTNALDQGGNSGWNLQTVPVTNFYWVGGSGNWSDKNHWSFTSGGSPGVCPVPSQNDNVFFDVNSFTEPNQYVNMDVNASCLNMSWNNVNRPRFVGGGELNIYGSMVLDPRMVWEKYNWTVFRSDSAGNTITTNGIKMYLLSFDGKGEWTLGDDITAYYDINVNSGTFRSGGHKITLGRSFACWSGAPTTIDLTGTDTVTVGHQFRIYPHNLSLAMGDAVVKFRGNDNFYFVGGNNTYSDILFNADNTGYSEIGLEYSNTIRNVKINAAGYQRVYMNNSSAYNDITMLFRNTTYNNPVVQISGYNTFNDMTITSIGNAGPYIYLYNNNTFNNLIIAGVGTRIYMGANQTQTVNDALALGNGSYPVWLQSNTPGVQATIYKPTGSVCMDYIWMRDMKATGGAIFNAGSTSLDQGNNTNWLFTSCAGFYWVGDAGNWSDYAHHWAYSSGGTIFRNTAPTQFDDVFFDANSFTTSGQAVTIDVPDARARNLSFASALYTPTLKSSSTVDEINVYGSLRLITNMNQNFTGKWNFKANTDSNEINTAGQVLGEVNFIGGNNGEGGWILRNNLTVSNAINLNNGTFYTNGKEVTTKYFNTSTNQIRKLYLGNSNINILDGAWSPSSLTNFTFSKGTSRIIVKGTSNSHFYGNGLGYHNVLFQTSGSLTTHITGANTFHVLRFEEGVTARLEPVIQQADSFQIAGTCAKPVNIQSRSTDSVFTFLQTAGTVNARFLQIKDNISTGGATFNANQSQDLGDVTGWNFTSAPIMSISTSSGLVNCTLNNDGWAKVKVLQGQSPFKYLWSTNETKDSISGLIPGTYTVTVTDSNGCKATDAVAVVNEPSSIAPADWNASAYNICQGTSIDFTPEEVSTALSFNGQNTSVQVANNGALNTSSFTLEAWINAAVAQSNDATILDKGSSLANATGWALQFNGSNGNIQFWTPAGSVVSASQLNDNSWHHLAVSYDGSELMLYVDGLLENTNAIGELSNSGTFNLLMGKAENYGNYFSGLIDEVRIWSVARSATEIQANRNIDLLGSEANLTAYYNMEYDYRTSRLKDLTVNANHGILNNFDTTTAWITPGAVNSTVFYIWNFGDFTTSTEKSPSKLYAEAGTYTVTLGTYDLNNCPNFVSKVIKVSKIAQNVTKVNIACKGEDNGSLTLDASGGISPYVYSIDNGVSYDSNAGFTGLMAGLYQVKVKDSIGCVTSAQSFTITEPDSILTFTLVQTPACSGTPNGTITVFSRGGTSPYQYSKNFGVSFQATAVFDQLNTGSYTIRIRDANKCLANDSTILVEELDVTKDGGIILGSGTVFPDENNTILRLTSNKGTIDKWQLSSDSLFTSPVDIANTTDSFQAVNLSVTTYYRAVINVGACGTVYSDFAEIVVSAMAKRIFITDSSSLTRFTYCPGTATVPKAFVVSGSELLSDVTIAAPSGFELSLDSLTGYTDQLVLEPVSGILAATRVFVRVTETASGSPSGNIEISSMFAYTESQFVYAATNNALHFDGTDDYVDFGTPVATRLTNNFSISAWIKTGLAAQRTFLTNQWKYPNTGILLGLNNSGKLHIAFAKGINDWTFRDPDIVLSDNKWHYVTVTFAGGLLRSYVDGNRVDSFQTSKTSVAYDGVAHLVIGKDGGDGEERWNGLIDEVSIWNKVLNGGEITTNMLAPLSGTENNLVAYWDLNQGTAEGNNAGLTTVYDRSPNAIHGTIYNMALSGSTSNWVKGKMPEITGTTDVYTGYTTQFNNVLTGGSWSSLQPGIATVNSSTGLVTGVAAGTATIRYELCGNIVSRNVIVTTAPSITVTGTLSAYNYCPGTASAAQSISVAGANLIGIIGIKAPSGIELSISAGSGYSDSLTLSPSAGSVSTTTIYVRVKASTTGSVSGNITFTSSYATTQTLSLSATAYVLPTVSILPDGATICTGDSIDLEATTSVSYLWSTGQLSQSVNVKSSGNFWVIITDANGCTARDTVAVLVQDTINPVLILPSDTLVNCSAVKDTVALGAARATDDCDQSPTIHYRDDYQQGSDPSQSNYYNYTIYRWWKATDLTGNIDSAKQTIRVQDTARPVITLPRDTSVNCNASKDTIVLGKPTATDLCDHSPVLTYRDDNRQGADPTQSSFYNYTIYRWWKATDASGNKDSARQTITVQDTARPVITRPRDTTVNCNALKDTIVLGKATASDLCDQSPAVTYRDDNHQGADPTQSSYYNYTIYRWWKATDVSGNKDSSKQTITIQDTARPVITRPRDTTVNCNALKDTIVLGKATASDLCDQSPAVTYRDDNRQGVDPTQSSYYNYTIYRWWKATDVSGNIDSVRQTITVQDTSKPTFTRPVDITIYAGPACTFDSSLTHTGDVSDETDNCSTGLQATYTDTVSRGGCQGAKTIKRTWRLTDFSGNVTLKTQTITVADTVKPTFTVPADITIYTGAACSFDSAVSKTGDVTDEADNCSTGLKATRSDAVVDGSCMGTKVIARTWRLEDSCGNVISKVQRIIVTDTTRPLITSCPTSSNRSTNRGTATYTIVGSEFNISATDNCSNQGSIRHTFVLSGATVREVSGSLDAEVIGLGITYVKAYAKDACDNISDTCFFEINVDTVISDMSVNNFTIEPIRTAGVAVFPMPAAEPISIQYSDSVLVTAKIDPWPSGTSDELKPFGKVIITLGDKVYDSINVEDDGSVHLRTAFTEKELDYLRYNAGLPTQGEYSPAVQAKNMHAEFVSSNPSYVNTSVTKNNAYIITKENAQILVDNVNTYFTANPTNRKGTVWFRANLLDTIDISRGDIRNATVQFYDATTGISVKAGTPRAVGLMDPAVTTFGTSVYSFDYVLNNSEASSGGKTWVEWAEAGNYYLGGDRNEMNLVTLAMAGNEYITGSGSYLIEQSNGLYAGERGKRMNFGLNLKWNSSGKNLQGQVNVIFRRIVNGKIRLYHIKSNAVDGLAVNTVNVTDTDGKTRSYNVATLNTKSSLSDISDPSNPVSLGGNMLLKMVAYDNMEQGNSGEWDKISVELLGANSQLLFSSYFSGVATQVRKINSGNLSVMNPSAVTVSCVPPAEVQTKDIDLNSAVANWTRGASVLRYHLRYRMQGAASWNVVQDLADTSYKMVGLQSGTAYEWGVQQVCSFSDSSSFTLTQFSTVQDCTAPPVDLVTNFISANSATVSWKAVSGVGSYNLEWKRTTDNSWTVVNQNVTSNTYLLTGLNEATVYQWRVRSQCSYGIPQWAESLPFTTLSTCIVPSQSVTNVTTNAVRLKWDAVSSTATISYNIRWRDSSVVNWSTTAVSINYYDLTGLLPATTYLFQVQPICNGNPGAWVNPTYFTTLASCYSPVSVQISNILSTSALVSWDAIPGSTGYVVEYRITNSSTWLSVNTSSALINLTSLTAGTAYEVRVKNVCNVGISNWTLPKLFTTQIDCKSSSLQVATIANSTSVTFNWTGPTGASYKLEYKKVGSKNWTVYNAGANTSYTVNLIKNAKYDWRVTAICSGVSGTSVNGITFTVGSGQLYSAVSQTSFASRSIIDEPANVSIYPNPAVEQFDLFLAHFKDGNVHVRMMDVLGNVVYDREHYIFNGYGKFVMSLQGKAQGVFMVQVIQGDQLIVRKVLKR